MESTIARCIGGCAGIETEGWPSCCPARQGGGGRKSYLDSDEMTLLGWEVKTGDFDSAKDVRNWIEAQCGVRYTMPGVYSLMKRVKHL